MTKRSTEKRPRSPRDFYRTVDPKVVEVLLPFLPEEAGYIEPCAGEGDLVKLLNTVGYYPVKAFDVEQRNPTFEQKDAFSLTKQECVNADLIITNPPWDRDVLHPMITHFKDLLPTWLLFDADWMHTKQAKEYLPFCRCILSVGRVKWFGNKHGYDNCCWYLFTSHQDNFKSTRFIYGS